jgi:hypothetical protein
MSRSITHRLPIPEGFTDTPGAAVAAATRVGTLKAYRTPALRHYGPRFFVENGERVLYLLTDLQSWIEADAARLRAKADARLAKARRVTGGEG